MNLQKILMPLLGVVLVIAAWRAYGWAGLVLAASAILMWVLLHFTRLMHVLKQAAQRPKGYVGSAVMLNARLKAGVTLLHVIAMTRSLGEQVSPKDEQPEIYRWTDGSHSHVTCEFAGGKLKKWALHRPAEPLEDGGSAPAP
ncbi:MAG: glycerate kinase [Ramlibacter sp.]|nr:glycerate kinase [Ramlibacter sp.]